MKALCLTLSLCLGSLTAMQAQTTWTGAGGDPNWDTTSNWNPNSNPGGGTSVTLLDVLNQTIDLNGSDRAFLEAVVNAPDDYTINGTTRLDLSGSSLYVDGAGDLIINSLFRNTGFGYIAGNGSGSLVINGALDSFASNRGLNLYGSSDFILNSANPTWGGNRVALYEGNLVLAENGSLIGSNIGGAGNFQIGKAYGGYAGIFNGNAFSRDGDFTTGPATLELDNSTTVVNDRLGDTQGMQLWDGATIRLRGNGSANVSETIGALDVEDFRNGMTIEVVNPAASQSTRLTIDSMNQNSSPILFSAGSQTEALGSATAAGSRVIFNTDPNEVNGVISANNGLGAFVSDANGINFATYDSTLNDGVEIGVRAFDYGSDPNASTDLGTALTTDNVLLSGSTSVAGTTVNSLKIEATGAAESLSITSGTLNFGTGLIYDGGAGGESYTITGGIVRGQNGGTNFFVDSGTLNVDSDIQVGASNPRVLAKRGDGELVVNGNLLTGGAQRDITVDDGAAAHDLTLNGVFADNNSGFEKLGLGTFRLTSGQTQTMNNQLTNGRTLLDGASQADQDTILGNSSSALTFNGGLLEVTGFDANLNLDTITISAQRNSRGMASSAITGSQALNITVANGSANDLSPGGGGDASFRIRIENEVSINPISGTATLVNTTSNNANIDDFTLFGSGQLTMGLSLGDGTNSATRILEVIQAGTGTLILTADNTYTGGTTVQSGTLLIEGDDSAATGAVLVEQGGTLGGSGVVGGATTIQGNLAPGSSPGLLTFASTLSLDPTAQINMEIDNVIRGTEYDAVDVTGSLLYGGDLTLTLGQVFAPGNYTFDLFGFGSESGDFLTVTLDGAYTGSLVQAGDTWTLTAGSSTFSFDQTTGDLGLTVIPEPGTTGLLLAGLGALIGLRRRRGIGSDRG